MNRTLHPVRLVRVPTALFDAAVSYLADVLRECQLALEGHRAGIEADPQLADLASALVPDLEELQEIFRSSLATAEGDRTTVDLEMRMADAPLLAHLQMQLIQLRLVGRRGAMLVVSDPVITQFLAWVWDEASDQLHGRSPRPYPT